MREKWKFLDTASRLASDTGHASCVDHDTKITVGNHVSAETRQKLTR